MNRRIIYKDYHEMDPKRYPFFRYHPDPIANGVFVEEDSPKVCQCCGKQETLICEGPFYTDEELEFICPECIANGKAAEKYDMDFCEILKRDRIKNEKKTEELLHHNPGYYSWNGGIWLSHCNDYCIYEGQIFYEELLERGLEEELKNDYYWKRSGYEDIETTLNNRWIQLHLFTCPHCGKHLFYTDEFFD